MLSLFSRRENWSPERLRNLGRGTEQASVDFTHTSLPSSLFQLPDLYGLSWCHPFTVTHPWSEGSLHPSPPKKLMEQWGLGSNLIQTFLHYVSGTCWLCNPRRGSLYPRSSVILHLKEGEYLLPQVTGGLKRVSEKEKGRYPTGTRNTRQHFLDYTHPSPN